VHDREIALVLRAANCPPLMAFGPVGRIEAVFSWTYTRKGADGMELLLSHWHCILPVALIAVAMLFMRDKPREPDREDDRIRKSLPEKNDME
jgi:hypothetical protein